MSSEVTSLAFDESGGTLVVHCSQATPHGSTLEAVQLDLQDTGVMADVVDGGTTFRVFVPYSNVIDIEQTA